MTDDDAVSSVTHSGNVNPACDAIEVSWVLFCIHYSIEGLHIHVWYLKREYLTVSIHLCSFHCPYLISLFWLCLFWYSTNDFHFRVRFQTLPFSHLFTDAMHSLPFGILPSVPFPFTRRLPRRWKLHHRCCNRVPVAAALRCPAVPFTHLFICTVPAAVLPAAVRWTSRYCATTACTHGSGRLPQRENICILCPWYVVCVSCTLRASPSRPVLERYMTAFLCFSSLSFGMLLWWWCIVACSIGMMWLTFYILSLTVLF